MFYSTGNSSSVSLQRRKALNGLVGGWSYGDDRAEEDGRYILLLTNINYYLLLTTTFPLVYLWLLLGITL